MIISEPKYAAATILANGETRKFDDISEMLIYHMEHPEAQAQIWFVHDHDTEEWIRGETAFFVKGNVNTPMGGAIAAFADRAAAKAFAAEVNGAVYNLDDLRVEVHLTMH
jgi:nitrous oxide reductase accessory protein NosL